MKLNLTHNVIEKALEERQRCLLWDTRVTGLYVEIRANGKGSYLIRYTHPEHGKQTITIGPTDVIKLEAARQKARELLAQVYLGEDPAHHKRQLKVTPTLNHIVAQYYLPHIQAYKKDVQRDKSLLKNHLLPVLGQHKLCAITTEEMAKIHRAMAERGLAPATCNHAIKLMRFLFNLAIKQWKIPGVKENPATAITLFKVDNQQQVFLSPEQIQRLIAETQKSQNSQLVYIVALLSLTGVRKRNVLDARWCDIDEDQSIWTIPVTKSGKSQVIYLSEEALQVLQILPSRGRSDYVVPNPDTGKPYYNIYYGWNTARTKAGLPHVRIHDLRHTFASLLINSGHSLYVVQKALGHHSPNVTMRYAHLADETLKQANNAVGHLVKASVSSVVQSKREPST